MRPQTHRKANGKGFLLKELLAERKEGRFTRSKTWGGRKSPRENRREAKQEVKELLG